MDYVQVYPGRLQGGVTIPPSKSDAHRAVICAALARGISRIAPIELSEDMTATLRAAKALGASIRLEGNVLTVDGSALGEVRSREIDCGESGSTLRFVIPIAAALGAQVTFTGRGRLPQRPLGTYLECLPPAGVTCQSAGGLPFSIRGKLRGGRFAVAGNVSSQFITGLLLALPLTGEESELALTTPLQSAGYVEMTIRAMGAFGVTVEKTAAGYRIAGGQRYQPRDYAVESDWSQAGFYLAAGALGGDLALHGLRRDSVQGDRAAEDLFSAFGARLEWQGEALKVSPGALKGITVDMAQIPDLAPPIAAVAALAEGQTEIIGAGRLRLKESDRLAALASAIHALGGKVREREDGLVIQGAPALKSGRVSGCNDHRIVMAMAMAALRAEGPVEITDPYSVRKSYPSFFDEYNRLGGNAHVFHVG